MLSKNYLTHLEVATSQIFAVISADPEIKDKLSGAQLTEKTLPLCCPSVKSAFLSPSFPSYKTIFESEAAERK